MENIKYYVISSIVATKEKKKLCDILAPVMFFNRKYLIFENITISSDGYLKI